MKNNEQQDKLWSCLTSTQRIICRGMHKTSGDGNVEFILDELFGSHNLTSDTEPEEMLMVSKKQVLTELCRAANLQNDKEEDWIRAGEEIEFTLTQLFGDKCLPDKELEQASVQVESKPKFKVGDKVRVVEEGDYKGMVTEIIAVDESDEDCPYQIDSYRASEEGRWFSDSDLEPCTEESRNLSQSSSNCDNPANNQLIDNMEEKELNLCELLKGYEGISIYSPTFGERIVRNILPDRLCDSTFICYKNGRIWEGGEVIIYPSRALYEKYPLDAYLAWMEWKEARKPKYILQAQLRLISIDGKTIEDYENVEVETSEIDLTKAEEAVRESLEKFHSNHTEQ
ncbi:MAG: hypothetical protein K2M41_02300 [Muribaculaceae bacterium]|nr:hypothetical protein [Muribaculaceae bacterium]